MWFPTGVDVLASSLNIMHLTIDGVSCICFTFYNFITVISSQYKSIFFFISQLYELDDDEKRKEFLDDLFSFMQKRGESCYVQLFRSRMSEAQTPTPTLQNHMLPLDDKAHIW